MTPMFSLARIALPEPAALTVYPSSPRVSLTPPTGGGKEVTYSHLEIYTVVDLTRKTITAQIARIQNPLLLYDVRDFAEAVTDTPEQHAARVLRLLGKDPATSLQALIDGKFVVDLAAYPRIPQEIANWRARVVLEDTGLLDGVEKSLAALPADSCAARAWQGGAPLARNSKIVGSLAAQLGLDAKQVDALFIHAAALEI